MQRNNQMAAEIRTRMDKAAEGRTLSTYTIRRTIQSGSLMQRYASDIEKSGLTTPQLDNPLAWQPLIETILPGQHFALTFAFYMG